MDSKEIQETLSAAYDYLGRLEELKQKVENAETQVITTADETEKKIEVIFSNLINSVTKTLEQRKQHLLDETIKIKEKKIKPLQECQIVITRGLDITQECVETGKRLLTNSHSESEDELLEKFAKSASILGCLPAVPDLTDVPLITLQVHPCVESDILKTCSSLGTIFHTPPVQIVSMTENPGSILVEWQNVEEQINDIQDFRLQKAFGNVLTDKHLSANFSDCYKGPDIQYLVKDLQVNQQYSFRVCCKFEGTATWSPWSLTQVAATKLEPFHWKTTEGFLLTNERRIAVPNDDSFSVLFSDGAQLQDGFSIEFTFLECDETTAQHTYIGLSVKGIFGDSDVAGSFYINAEGVISVDGAKKSTVLPKVRKGSKICFTCSSINENKVRVNVDSGDKRVTYDWATPNEDRFYFFSKFGSAMWKIMVE